MATENLVAHGKPHFLAAPATVQYTGSLSPVVTSTVMNSRKVLTVLGKVVDNVAPVED